ncbi:hypothetical protein DCE79_07455 [Lysinibacillus sp. 2017]|nr:hypothetical protein DCE79_07455 [Lysinibacillus sp. 2017]TGN34684.1 hypothetical protein E4L99_13645 [Lysinibacillus sp. S2017]
MTLCNIGKFLHKIVCLRILRLKSKLMLARVWLQEEIAKIVQSKVTILLIGERPGLNTAESMSAYIIYKPNEKTVEADRTVISNIHENGLSPSEAGAYLSELIEQMLKLECTRVAFMRKKIMQTNVMGVRSWS